MQYLTHYFAAQINTNKVITRRSLVNILILSVAIFFSNCASILNSRYQKVQLYTNVGDAKIYADGVLAGKGKHAEGKVKRDFRGHQLKIEANGYKPEYKVALQHKTSPLYIMSWIPFGAFALLPPFADHGQKSKNYEAEYTINPQIKISPKSEKQKYIYLQQTAFDVKKEDMIFEHFRYNQYIHNRKSKDSKTSTDEIEISNSIFTDAINDVLKKYGYTDTTKTVFQNKTNTMYITSKVSKVKLKRITSPYLVGDRRTNSIYTNGYGVAEVTTQWDLLDIYDQTKYTKQITSQSGEFISNYDPDKSDFDRTYVAKSIEDALTTSIFNFLADANVKKLIDVEVSKPLALTPLTINTPVTLQSLKNAQSSTVTISSKDGHGSGCLISKDGMIVTNFHVIAGVKDALTITLNNGTTFKSKIVRVNEDADLALLSIVNPPQDLSYFSIPTKQAFEIGDEVFAIGTPKSLELSQTLTKGIISGVRKVSENRILMQTDVSVNAGNSGGALVSKQGQLLGVVNSKLVGLGVEGISFCIPANDISKLLSVQVGN